MLNNAGDASAALVDDLVLAEASGNYEGGELVALSLVFGVGLGADSNLGGNCGSQHMHELAFGGELTDLLKVDSLKQS